MYVLVYICSLFLILKSVEGQSLSIVFRSVTYNSNQVIPLTSVGEGADAVICMTTRTNCCKGTGKRNGEWYYPNGSIVPNTMGNEDFYRTLGTQQVILNRRNNAMSPTGCFCCELMNATERICITLSMSSVSSSECGPMTSSTATTVTMTMAPTVPPPPQLMVTVTGGGTFTAGQTHSHTLTCQVSGGDASMMASYQWLKDDQVLNGQTSSTLSFSPLRDTDAGRYNCRGTKGPTSTSGDVVITVSVPTFSVTISSSGQPTEGQRYVLACNVNGAGSLSASFTYRYQWDRVGSSSDPSTSQQLTFNQLRRRDGGQYRCTATISSQYLTSTRSVANTRTVTVTRLRPDPVISLTVTASATTATSITITWTVSSTTVIPITGFEVTYSYTVRRCSAPAGASRTDSISDGRRRSHTLRGLNQDSDYTITVRVINDVGSSMATTTRGTTDTSAPSASPGSVSYVIQVVDEEVVYTVGWSQLNCVDRNGDISYKIRHGPSSTLTSSNTRTFDIVRLSIRSSYSVEVAAVAGGRTGPYSHPILITTPIPNGFGFYFKGALYANNSILVINNIEALTNGLYCLTDETDCCRGSDGGANGGWFFPNSSAVEGSGTFSMLDFSRSRGPSAVILNRRNNAVGPTGLYRCEVSDASGVSQSVYVGLYPINGGSLSVSHLSYSRSSRTLNCTSTGGPVVNVIWSKDGDVIPPSSSSHQWNQNLYDGTTATYHNLLSITSSDIRDYNGSFTCTVNNTRGSSQPMSQDISAISITGNMIFQIGDNARITCSSVVGNVMIQWSRGSDVVAQMSGVHQLALNFTANTSFNNTKYACTVIAPSFQESSSITIQVGGGNLPRIPEMVEVMSITETAATIQWSFSSPIGEGGPETYTVLYGTSPDQLVISSPSILSDVNMQQYTQMLGSLQPGTMYYIEIQSRNVFTTRMTVDMTRFQTIDMRSSEIRSVLTSRENGTLHLTWQPPDSPGGTILNYTVQIIPLNDEETRSEVTTTTMFSATNLTPGVPYNVTIWANNLAGQGAVALSTYFIEELVPNTAPKNVETVRTSPTTISVTWTPLTLIEARGFIRYYSVSYTPNTNGRKRQASLEAMYVNVSNTSTSATIMGLEQSFTYNVRVAAATSAGIGAQSPPSVAKIISTPDSSVAGIAAGVVVALVVVVIVIIIAIIILMTYRRRKERHFSPAHSKSESIRFSKPKKAPPTAPKKKKGKAVDTNDEEKDLDDQYYENTVFIVKDRFKPVPIEDFGEHVQRMHADRDKWFELEYNAVEKSPQADYNVAQIPENRARNRFGNIFPYDFNRVVLKTVSGVEHSDYINASYVDGYQRKNVYIGAQGPVENSVEDFWRMVWEQHCPTIVMLTRIFEGRKKCEEYWPKSADEPYVPGPGSPLCIKLNSTLPFAEFDLRKMTVTSEDEPNASPLKVTMFHYMAWPDHGVPANAVSMINFIRRVRKTHPYSNEDLLLVHCSAGVGRTGTFITLDYMLERIKRERNINIYEFVCNLRKQRVLMVQTPAQYVFIHNALDELITCGETEIAAANMRIVIGKLSRTNQSGTETGYHKQYEILEKITSEIKSVDFSNAMSEPNIPKNRYKDKIPYNHTRIRLRPSAAQGSDYINASFVEGYRQKGAYIATQGPLPHTVNDFWRMIWEQEVKCIVMLCRTEEKGEEVCRQFWPLGRGSSENFDKYTVSLTSQQNTNDYVIRKMEILENQTRMSISQSGFTVTLFQYLRWPEDGVPQMTTPVLEIANLVQKVQMGSGNKAIVVMCNDGVGRTGAFITMHAQMERMKAEAVVDIFQFIKAIRVQRAGLVSTKGQYEFCHQVLADFLDGFDTYANFKEII